MDGAFELGLYTKIGDRGGLKLTPWRNSYWKGNVDHERDGTTRGQALGLSVYGVGIKALTDFLARPKGERDLLWYMHCRSGFRVMTYASRQSFDTKCTKTPQLYPLAADHRRNDSIKNGVDDLLSVAPGKVRILSGNSQHQL